MATTLECAVVSELTVLDSEAERIGFHFARSDQPWQAIPYLEIAARRALAVFAHPQAVSAYEQAIELGRRYPTRIQRAQLAKVFEGLGDLLTRLGDIRRAVETFEEAMALIVASGDAESALRLRGKVALGYIVQSRVPEATDLLQKAVAEITAQSPQLGLARTYYALAQLHWHTSRHRAALEASEQSVLAADASGDVEQQARAYEALALSCHSLGDWQRGLEYELKRTTLPVSGYDVDSVMDAHLCLWEYHLYGDQPYAEVERMIRQALNRAMAFSNPRALALCYHVLGAVLYLRGDWLASR